MVIDKIKKNNSSMKNNLPSNWRGPRGFLQSSSQAIATAVGSSEKTSEPRLLSEEERAVNFVLPAGGCHSASVERTG